MIDRYRKDVLRKEEGGKREVLESDLYDKDDVASRSLRVRDSSGNPQPDLRKCEDDKRKARPEVARRNDEAI